MEDQKLPDVMDQILKQLARIATALEKLVAVARAEHPEAFKEEPRVQ